MKMSLRVCFLAVGLTVIAACATTVHAQTIAGDDFDGGANNGGFAPTSLTLFEGDADNGTSEAHDNTFNGLFDFGLGSRFDRFGTVNREIPDDEPNEIDLGLPFDVVDNSVAASGNGAGMFADDNFGILNSTHTDNKFMLSDTLNGTNSGRTPDGAVSAFWTFDVSAGSDMQISIDFAAIGEFDNNDGAFETDDFLTFTYSIDGGPTQTAFDVRPDEVGGADTGIFYSVTMENGNVLDRYSNPFFEEDEWDQLTTTGPSGGLDYHPLDDGVTNGDTVAQDGLIPVEGALGVVNERALRDGSFDDVEHEVYKDAMIVNSGTPSSTALNNQFQTVTVPIVGSGDVLTLKLLAVADGSLEYVVFDNILIEEAADSIDFDGSGTIDGPDLLAIQILNPSLTGQWQEEYGSNAAATAAAGVPEPAVLSLCVTALSLLTIPRRRR